MNVTDRSFANYEGVCVGPKLKDGRLLLMLVADSQDQYKGYLKDWFRSIAIANIDFKPQPNAGNNLSAVLKAISSAGNDSGL